MSRGEEHVPDSDQPYPDQPYPDQPDPGGAQGPDGPEGPKSLADLRVHGGTLLAAWPDLMDPNFMHSVLLMCEHSEKGAFGFIVNRRTEHTTRELLPDHAILGKLDFPLHQGGPVEPAQLQLVHTVPDAVTGGFPLSEHVFLGGDLEQAASFIADDPVAAEGKLRLLLGYAGWAPGQLEKELVVGSWLPAPLAPETVFEGSGEEVWRRVVRSIGDAGGDLENLPPDVSWN